MHHFFKPLPTLEEWSEIILQHHPSTGAAVVAAATRAADCGVQRFTTAVVRDASGGSESCVLCGTAGSAGGTAVVNHMAAPCGHMCLCDCCGTEYSNMCRGSKGVATSSRGSVLAMAEIKSCPVCREEITHLVKVYPAGREQPVAGRE